MEINVWEAKKQCHKNSFVWISDLVEEAIPFQESGKNLDWKD
jgi:hypothetical protein